MKRASLWFVAAGLWAVAPMARAGGVLGAKDVRLSEESVLVVWNGPERTNHVFYAARATSGTGAVVVLAPSSATLAPAVPKIGTAFAALSPALPPLTTTTGDGPIALDGEKRASAFCAAQSLACNKDLVQFVDAAKEQKAFALGLAGVGGKDEGVTPYAHWVFDAEHPVAPFADPPGAPAEVTSPDAAPRVTTWLELGLDTKTGAWERSMDEVVRGAEVELGACWGKVARGARGDVHVQLRLGGGKARAEGERASGASVQKLARCWAEELEKKKWPDPPRATTVEVHAVVKPGAATKRAYRAYVLSTSDVEPRLGADFGGALPDGKVEATFEPDPKQLGDAFDPPTRAALGIDLARRHRLVVVSSGADPHPREDLHFRTLALPPPKPGEIPLPIVEPGDRPDVPHARTPFHRTRRAKLLAAALGVALLLAFAFRASRERPREV